MPAPAAFKQGNYVNNTAAIESRERRGRERKKKCHWQKEPMPEARTSGNVSNRMQMQGVL